MRVVLPYHQALLETRRQIPVSSILDERSATGFLIDCSAAGISTFGCYVIRLDGLRTVLRMIMDFGKTLSGT